jgi:hypothetical protein
MVTDSDDDMALCFVIIKILRLSGFCDWLLLRLRF